MAGPYASLTSPYAPGPGHMDSAFKIADLIGQQGQSAAQAQYAKRLLVGDLVSGIGNTVGNIFERRDQQKTQAAEAQVLADLFSSGKPVDLPTLIQTLGIDRAKAIYPLLEAEITKREARAKEAEAARAKQNEVGMRQRTAGALAPGTGVDPQQAAIQHWSETGTLPPAGLLPDPAKVAAAAAATAEKEARGKLEAALNTAGGDPERERQAYRAYVTATGKDAPAGVFTPAPKVAEPVTPGSFEDYLARYAKERNTTVAALTSAQLEDAKKRLNQADDRPRITVNTGGEGALPPRVETTVRGLATAFRNEAAVKRVVTMAEGVNFVNSLNLNTTNPADDQALIYAFAKAMDPESVVREGEYATVAKYAQSWKDNFGFDAMRILSSNTPILTSQARQNLKATITSRYQASRGSYDTLARSYTNQINTATGLTDGSERLTDYAGLFPGGPPSGGAPGGGGQPGGVDLNAVKQALSGKVANPPPAKPYTLGNGTKWRKNTDGSVQQVQ